MAAACKSLILPENPILYSWKQIINMKPIEESCFTEVFGQLHFKDDNVVESVESSSFSSSPILPGESSPCSLSLSSLSLSLSSSAETDQEIYNKKEHYKRSNSISSTNSENSEEMGNETSFNVLEQPAEEEICFCKESKIGSKTSKGSFPPPISCIGRTGKPCVCFRSYRQDGRFILQEIRFPTQEFLHACRGDGRLKLLFIQSDDEILEDDEEDDYDDSEDENLE